MYSFTLRFGESVKYASVLKLSAISIISRHNFVLSAFSSNIMSPSPALTAFLILLVRVPGAMF